MIYAEKKRAVLSTRESNPLPPVVKIDQTNDIYEVATFGEEGGGGWFPEPELSTGELVLVKLWTRLLKRKAA